MPTLSQNFRIHRIRMINFHNFTNETITIENGGHLFMLGDNGSGKTTVLDAVHYTLTAGKESMEFNSAARVAGSRKDSGRRAQGIVMRYNINAEPPTLNTGGGVTYAAIELKDQRGNLVVLAVGLSCSSMDEAIQHWGIIRSGTLEEIPFILEELNGNRPRNRREMKAALDGKGFYSQIGSYRRELAKRLFGGESSYAEVCKFLATGKAYREIVSRAADYHQLFRELLQEPDPEIFEKVIDHLKSLENSRQDLERMKERLAFLTELTNLHAQVETLHRRQSALCWLSHDLKQKQYLKQHQHITEEIELEKNRLTELNTLVQKNELSYEDLNNRIYELGNKDQGGLVERQRHLEHEVKTASTNMETFQLDWDALSKKLNKQEKELRQQRKQLLKHAQTRFAAIHKATAKLPVSAQTVLSGLDAATTVEHPEQQLADINAKEVMIETDKHLVQAREEKQNQQYKCNLLAENIQKLDEQLVLKRKQGEAQPNLEGFSEAQKQITENLFNARPLYTGLEPRDGISRKELSALEQLIGEEVLGSWLTPPEEENAVRQLLFTRFPNQTLAVVEPNANDRLSDWIRHWFDPAKSDPFALIALQREMESANAPATKKLNDFEYITFRARQQKLHRNPVRLLGSEMRRKQLEQEIKALESKIKAETADQKIADAILQKKIDFISALHHLKETLELQELRSEALQTTSVFHATEQSRLNTENVFEQLNRAEEDLALANDRLAEVRLRIESEGLHDLEQQIANLKKERNRKKKHLDLDKRNAGKLENEIQRANQLASGFVKSIQEELEKRRKAEQKLQEIETFEDATLFVSKIINTANYLDAAEVETELDKLRLECNETQIDLKHMASGHEGQSFAFTFNREHNTLSDRRGMTANQVREELDRNFQEQSEIITEETRRLFEQFIMQDLLAALRDRVTRLTDMSRRISKILKEREFGSNRYTFKAKPLDQYKRLYNLIRNYSELAAEDPAKELKEFIEEHQEAILNTEPGDMPELLDYRNWFHFDLQVKTGSQETTMTRQTKSIGSGGEQAVPNYLIILTIAHFLYDVPSIKLPLLLFDEAFYGIDAQRRDQLLAFASDLNLQLFVASPDQDGVKKEIPSSTSLFVIKDKDYNIHLHDFHWNNPKAGVQQDLLDPETTALKKIKFGEELGA